MTLLNANDARKLSMPKNCSKRFISAISKSSESSASSCSADGEYDALFVVVVVVVVVVVSSVFCFFLAFVSSPKISLNGFAHTQTKVLHAVKKSAAFTLKWIKTSPKFFFT